jgi:hypothetical protein
MERFSLKLTRRAMKQVLPATMLDRLDRCRDDDFRKVLLGITGMTAFPKPKESQTFPANVDEKIAIRKAVYLRDKGRCVICEKRVILERGFRNSMHLSHIKSKGSGADWSMVNLQVLCPECHLKSHNCDGKPVPKK